MVPCGSDCGHGHCDTSVGLCICPPGWKGAACEDIFLGACRMSLNSSITACDGFNGPMSCRCIEQCSYAMDMSINHKICFEVDGQAPNTSALPSRGRVRFFTRQLLKVRGDMGWTPIWGSNITRMPGRWNGRVKEVQPLPGTPVPVALTLCPDSCNYAGTCSQQQTPAARTFCSCHSGFRGASCELSDFAACANGCSGHGRCVGRVCICHGGWFGFDCSLSHQQSPGRTSRYFAPTFVYPFPTVEPSMRALHLRTRRHKYLFSSNRIFLEMLHSRKDAIVSDPEEAALFFVPVMISQLGTNTWNPTWYLKDIVQYLSHTYPYWNRTEGADHVFFTTQDMGGCQTPRVVQNAVVVSLFGWKGFEGTWIDETLWRGELRERGFWRQRSQKQLDRDAQL